MGQQALANKQTVEATYAAGGTQTTGGNLDTARRGLAGAGTQAAGLAIGGRSSSGGTAATEEYTKPIQQIVTVTTS